MATDRKERGSYSLDEDEYAELLAGTPTIPGKVPLTARLAPPPGSSPQPFDVAAAWRTIPKPDDGSSPGSTTPLDGTMRRAAESSLGVGLGGVRVHQGTAGSTVADRHAAQAVTIGGDIFLGSQVDNSKNWVLAHEVAHVAQQRGAAPSAQAKRIEGPSEGVHEQEADRAADAIMTGRPASVTPTGLQVARFAPESHRQATVEGLQAGTGDIGFTAEEIGQVYASNWERDFSQGAPEVAACAIAWKAVVQSADARGGAPDAGTCEQFKAAIDALVARDVKYLIETESLSGYQPWEHMDRPDDEAAADADRRWGKQSNGLAGYICDSVAYLKDEMLLAVNAYRSHHKLAEVGKKIDNWKGSKERPRGYDGSVSAWGAAGKDTGQPQAAGKDLSRDPVAQQAAGMARDGGNKTGTMTPAEKELWQKVGHHLGRSMHAFEDFWAHSNWLELAKEFKARKLGLKSPDLLNEKLVTGDFRTVSKLHALGHKLKSLSASFLAKIGLMRKVYGRSRSKAVDLLTRADPLLRDEKSKVPWTQAGGMHRDMWDESPHPMDAGADVAGQLATAKLLTKLGILQTADFMCSEAWLQQLNKKADDLIKSADAAADGDSHGKIAKDQPEDDKDSSGAGAIAAAANRAVFAPLKAIMQEQNTEEAEKRILGQIELVDRFICAPHDGHPLMGLVPEPKERGRR